MPITAITLNVQIETSNNSSAWDSENQHGTQKIESIIKKWTRNATFFRSNNTNTFL